MKRLLTLSLLLLFTVQLSATHIKGGELHYNYLGSNNYQVVLKLYRDVTGINLPSTENVSVSGIPGVTAVSLPQDTNYFINSCAVNIQIGIYKGVVNIPSVPGTGAKFVWSSCCRTFLDNVTNAGSQAFYLEADLMPVPGGTYSSSSPRFMGSEITAYAGAYNIQNTVVFDPNPQDSIFTELINVMGNNGTPLTYNMGYSYSQPFGTSVPVSIDPQSGILTIDGPALGVYAVGIKVSTFRSGQLTGSSMRDMPIFVEAHQDSLAGITIANLNTSGTSTIVGNTMHVELSPSDSISFVMIGSVNSLDTVTISGQGKLFGSGNGTSGPCAGANCATFTSSAYTAPVSAQGVFSFKADPSLFVGNMTEYNATVSLFATVSASCNSVSQTPFAVYISVKKPASIWGPSQLPVCGGGSVQAIIQGDTSNVVWSPTTGVSDPNSPTPMLSPTVPTTYTITNLNDSLQIQLTVNIDSINAANLIDHSTWVELPNFNDYDAVVWYYNGIPLAANVDSFAMPYPGDYFAYVTSGACSAFSDTVIKVNKNMVPTFGTGTGTAVNTDGFAEFEFKLNGIHGNTLNSINVALPDSGTYKTGNEPWFMLMDGTQTIIATGTASMVSTGYYSLTGLNVTINANETYRLFVDLYSGPTVFTAPSSLPHTEANGLITILSAKYDDNGTQMNDAYPPVVFGMASGVEVEENQLANVSIYPNPTNAALFIEVDESTRVRLFSTTGALLESSTIESKTEFNLEHLPSGMYMLELQRNGTVHRQKVVKQ